MSNQASGSEQTPPGWFPDPAGRHEVRYWDGLNWTDQVASQGRNTTDPLDGKVRNVSLPANPNKIGKQVGSHEKQSLKRGVEPTAASSYGPGLLDQPMVIVNQKAKLLEIHTEYAIYNKEGQQIGAIRQVGQSFWKKALRFFGNLDQYFTHSYQVVDASGIVQLAVTRPRKIFKSKLIVNDGSGNEVGRVVQQNMIGKIRFGFMVGEQEVGGIFAENWRAWNFSIKDQGGNEVARITKTFEGVLKTMFTTADNYVLEVHSPLSEPLKQFVFSSTVAIDTALKQDARGLGA